MTLKNDEGRSLEYVYDSVAFIERKFDSGFSCGLEAIRQRVKTDFCSLTLIGCEMFCRYGAWANR